MCLVIDLRMKPVTHEWAISGKKIFLHPVEGDLSFHIKGFFILFAFGWGY